MSIIPDHVIKHWHSQYSDGSALWTQYPEINPEYIRLLVEKDRSVVYEICFRNIGPVQGQKPVYVATAGAPLAGKSTILEQEITKNPDHYGNLVKVDPDRWGMLFMINTYHGYLMSASTVADADKFETAQRRAYDVARPGSNILTLEILNKAVEGRYDIAHGTTMTGNHINTLLSGLKDHGYEIDLFLCGASDEMRAEAQKYRATVQGYYQATAEEIISKGKVFPQRMVDYFKFADNLAVFWRNGVTENAIKAATYTNGRKTIVNQEAYTCFVEKYETDCHALADPEDGKPITLPGFVNIEKLYFDRFSHDASLTFTP